MSWLNLASASQYSGLSAKTLMRSISDPINPLPARFVRRRWLIKDSDLDEWIESHPSQSRNSADMEKIVDEVLASHLSTRKHRPARKLSSTDLPR